MARFDSEWEKVLKKSQPSFFSDEIVFEILSRLPVKSIIRFKCVCKKWHELFGDSSFAAAHLNRSVEESNYRYFIDDRFCQTGKVGRVGYYLSDEKFEELLELPFQTEPSFYYEIVASVDGLVCIQKVWHLNSNVLLWNPATRELRTLPECPGSVHDINTAIGFGFDPKNNDYKVVRMTSFEVSKRVDVYSLRTGKWRSFEVDEFKVYHINGELVNCRLHWIVASLYDMVGMSIVSFDLSEEKIIKMGVPSGRNLLRLFSEPLKSLGKSLVLPFRCNEEGTEIWFMKKYGDTKSWSKLYNFPQHPVYGYMTLCSFLENGEVILLSSGTNKIVSYDPKNQMYKILNCDYHDDIFKYKESLLSVEGGRSFSNRNQRASISDSSSD